MKEFSADQGAHYLLGVAGIILMVLVVFNFFPHHDLKGEGPTKFEVIQDGIRGIEVIRDMETGCEYLVVRVDGGVGVTRLQTPECE